MKNLVYLIFLSLFLAAFTPELKAQITEKPNLEFKVEFNDLNEQLEVVWANCLENSVVKVLDSNLKPLKTQVLCKDMGGVIDISDLQSDLYYVQIEHYTGVGIQPIVKAAKETNLAVNDERLKEDLAFSVYPNPAQDKITIEGEHFASNSVVTILDLQGRQIQSSTLDASKLTLDISNLTQGVYFVRIEDADKIGVQQLIKK